MQATLTKITAANSTITARCLIDIDGSDDIAIVVVPWSRLSDELKKLLEEAVKAELATAQTKPE